MFFLLLLLALVGHAYLWAEAVNRVHAFAMPRWGIQTLSALCFTCLFLLPVGLLCWLLSGGGWAADVFGWGQVPHPGPILRTVYFAVCWVLALIAISRWTWQGLWHRPPAVLRFHRSRPLALSLDATLHAEEHAHHFLVHLPCNEILRLHVIERILEVPRLPPALDGLSIVHLSDFHFTGRVGKAYFREVVRVSNEAQADLVALTGDLVDKAAYIDWVPDTLGKLTARFGVYFVLGNHDVWSGAERLRKTLVESGLVDVGGRWIEVAVRGVPVVLAGNELPWLPPAADMSDCPGRNGDGSPLRIVLAHSPDQWKWARSQDADLMLAGHTHGGQIRLPLIGPVLAPSWRGVKYASGIFYAPPTILHVTRGVSGELPIRFNCPPEMVRLVLRGGRGT